MALEKGVPEVHHSDQGVQYAAKEYVELLERHEVKISMARRCRPDENGYAERLIRTIKEEEVELSEYEGFWDAKERIWEFIEEVYQRKRIHSALGYLTPEEFEEKWHRERETAGTLSKDGLKSVQLLGSTTSPRIRRHFEWLEGEIASLPCLGVCWSWADYGGRRSRRWWGWPRSTGTAAGGVVRGGSGEAGPQCGRCCTWRRWRRPNGIR